MMEITQNASLDDLEITVDFLSHPSFVMIFLGELLDRRSDMIETLIAKGEDECRYKVQMIDEVIGLRDEILAELKSRKDNAH